MLKPAYELLSGCWPENKLMKIILCQKFNTYFLLLNITINKDDDKSFTLGYIYTRDNALLWGLEKCEVNTMVVIP